MATYVLRAMDLEGGFVGGCGNDRCYLLGVSMSMQRVEGDCYRCRFVLCVVAFFVSMLVAYWCSRGSGTLPTSLDQGNQIFYDCEWSYVISMYWLIILESKRRTLCQKKK